MRFEYDGMALWFGTPDAPSLSGDILADSQREVVFTVAVQPADASNRVHLRFRTNGEQAEHAVDLQWWRNDISGKAQYFRARLPVSAFRPGDTVEYTAVCSCAGRQVPSPEEVKRFASSFRVVGTETGPAPAEPADPQGQASVLNGITPNALRLQATSIYNPLPASPLQPQAMSISSPLLASAPQPIPPQASVARPIAQPPTSVPIPVSISQPPPASIAQPLPPSPALSELSTTLGLAIPRELLSALSQRGIYTLGDIRNAGGIARLSGLPAAHSAAVSLLEAHAELSRLSPDLSANATLIAKGYTSALTITSVPQEDFVAATHDQLGDFGAAQLHVAASTQVSVLNNILMDLMANPADETIANNSQLASVLHDIPDLGLNYCQCDDCRAAMSPAAYLTDLLSYALKHLKRTLHANVPLPMTVGVLADSYHQPFGELPTDCDAVNKQVRQVRICVEVLRGSFRAIAPSANLLTAEKGYRLAAYTTLLAKLGTSYDEVRLVRSASRQTREALADRLGISIAPLGSARPDQLDGLFLDPAAVTPAPEALTEANLESLFGLIDTTRDPISDGRTVVSDSLTAAAADQAKQTITHWNLKGVEWGRNTDNDGNIYVRVTDSATQGFCVAELYRDSQLQDLIAADEEPIGTPMSLAEKNNSGLSGQMIVSFTGAVTGIALAAMPRLTAWKLAHLRTMWEEEDRPTDPFREGLSIVELAALPPGVQIPPLPQPSGIGYDSANRVLTFAGVMTAEQQNQWLALSKAGEYQTAIRSLFVQSQRPPMIDPDVIGPDDFRVPVGKSGSGPDKAFDLWLKRRAWVHAQLDSLVGMTKNANGKAAPDLDRMITAMYKPVNYGAGVTGWNDTTSPTAFVSLQDDLTQGIHVETAKLRLASDLALTVGGFLQLMTIRTKDQAARIDSRIQVSPDEWDEVRSILIQSWKTRLFPAWRTEEQLLGVLFSGEDFWISIGEPTSGTWPPAIPDGHPLIDPEVVKETDLPESTAGRVALSMLHDRVKILGAITAALRAEREKNGFDSMVTLALGPLQETLDQLKNDLQTNNASAIVKINNELCMTVDEFNRLMVIKTKASDPNVLKRPMAEEWTEAYQILTSAQKRKREFPVWISKEAGAPLFYWSALKAKLPPWRAPVESRQAWQTALRNRTAPPIIDPDLINLEDLKNPVSGDAAYDIWSLRSQLGQTSSTARDGAGLEALISDGLGVAVADLESLEAAQLKGNSIDGRLNQLNLTAEALSQLLRVRELLKNKAPVIDSEWSDVYSILAQVVKTRQNAGWQQAEASAHITLSPDFFQIPEVVAYSPVDDDCPPPEPASLPAWRASWNARRDWQDALQSRIDQQNAVIIGVSQASDTTEEATLTKLRDALIMASPADGTCLETKAKSLTSKFLIDMQQGCCRKTTRIAQALETIQTLLWGLRTGEIEKPQFFAPINPDLGSNFDEEWKWMGSYATWRSAMLVWMYPENVLPPSLRKWQTPGFRKLVNDVRANPRLTPDQACTAAREYSDYFRDVCTLSERTPQGVLQRIEASCQTSTLIHINKINESCRYQTETDHRSLFYLFGQGDHTKKVYWSAYDEKGEPGYTQSFWDRIPGLEMENVVNLIGAVTYEITPTRRFLCLFARCSTNGVQKLVLTKYDLEDQNWESGKHTLDLPANSAYFDIVILPRNLETDLIRVRIRPTSGLIYERQLNRDASDWDIGDWQPIMPPWTSWFPISDKAVSGYNTQLTAVVHPDTPARVDLFSVQEDGTVIWTWWDGNDIPTQWQPWQKISPSNTAKFGFSVSAVSRKPNQIDLFIIDNNNSVQTASWHNSHQGLWPWRQLGTSSIVSTKALSVAVVNRGPSHLDIFTIDNSGNIITTWWDENPALGNWPNWLPVNTSHTAVTSAANVSEVTAVARDGHLDLFMVDNDGAIWTTWWDVDPNLGQWPPWLQISPPDTVNRYIATVTAVARNPFHLDLFAVDKDGTVLHTWWDADPYSGQWSDWVALSAPKFAGDGEYFAKVSAISRNPNRLDLFVVSSSKFARNRATSHFAVWSTFWDANIDQGVWHPWVQLYDIRLLPYDSVTSVSRNPDHIDLFVTPGIDKPGIGLTPVSGEYRQVYSAFWQGVEWTDASSFLVPPIQVAPSIEGPYDVSEIFSSIELQSRRFLIKKAFNTNLTGPTSNLTYLEETYYFIPVFLALQLQQHGYYTEALDWFRTVYDYSVRQDDRKIYDGLRRETSLSGVSQRVSDWLLDPLNPHLIASTRRSAYTRYTIMSIVRCLLDFADAEFTYDTAESNDRARTLYMTALGLLDLPEFNQSRDCEALRITLDAELSPFVEESWRSVWNDLKRDLARVTDSTILETVMPKLSAVMSNNAPWPSRFARAKSLIADAKAKSSVASTIGSIGDKNAALLAGAYPILLGAPSISKTAASASRVSAARFLASVSTISGQSENELLDPRTEIPWLRVGQKVSVIERQATLLSSRYSIPATDVPLQVPSGEHLPPSPPAMSPSSRSLQSQPLLSSTVVKQSQVDLMSPYSGSAGTAPDFPTLAPSYWFCTPLNPVLKALRLHTELNLKKLHHCLNIVGMQRQLDFYSAPTDMTSGLPMIGSGDQLLLPGTAVFHPTAYRYATLVERAKQLVQIAAQIEAAMLSALEKRDAEAYNRLKARQDMRLTAATVQLRDLQMIEAQAAVRLAQLQQDRARIQADHWQKLLNVGISGLERASLDLLSLTAAYHYGAAAEFFAAGAIPSIASLFSFGSYNLEVVGKGWTALSEAVKTTSDILSTQASYERRTEGWEFDLAVAQQDERIGGQQVSNAEEHVRSAEQERSIAQLQADHAGSVVDFLSNKFTSVELYDWMSGVLQRVYSSFLQQATAMAKLAENQLAFERQEVPPAFIQADYWTDPADGGSTTNSKLPDRRGLTGSARLLQDIYQLDQHAFLTNQRKLQLTKTISLQQQDPYEFARFCETGVMNFATPMELFDRDFPGHYLRLIKRVRTSVIALIPPTQGIRATLSTTAASRVVIGTNGYYQSAIVRRDPQFVALSSPINATGLFELDPQSDLLMPFEGLGVEAHWEFRMPKAANLFDYRTIADVLITIEYTALSSFDYGQQVTQRLRRTFSANRPFSFRHELADQWYDFHNPAQTSTPMTVRFETAHDDFPPNLEDLRIQHVTLYFARADGKTFEVPVSSLHFTAVSTMGASGGAATSIDGMINTRNGNASSWTSIIGKSPIGTWELSLPDRIDIKNLFKDEEIEDILFVITYSGRTPAWPA